MTRIQWHETGKRQYETGVSKGVLYLANETGGYSEGEAWNGLTSISESPEGAEANPVYADNIKYLNLISAEEFKGTIEAYFWPDTFELCDGTREIAKGVTAGQQKRATFGLSYQTILGNELKSNAYGYKIHLVYGAIAQPSERTYETVNDSPEPATFSWEFDTIPVSVPGMDPTSILVINSTKVDPERLQDLENILYGSDADEGYLPLPEEVISIVGVAEKP